MADETMPNYPSGFPSLPISEQVRQALQYSRNYASASPYANATSKEHINGLCDLVERLHALLTAQANTGERDVTIKKAGLQLLLDAVGGHGAVLQFLTLGRYDLALEESSMWVGVFAEAADIHHAQGHTNGSG